MDTFKSNSEEILFSKVNLSDDSSGGELMATHLSYPRFEDQLTEAFLKSHIRDNEFSSDNFFYKWFGNKNSAFFFLFKKNLSVTNIQFSELLALLRCYTKSRISDESIRNLQFLTLSEFENIIDGIIEAFLQTSDYSKDSNNIIKHVVDLYYPLLSRVMVVESFYGSCAVYVPPNLNIDLLSICAKSGYIDSCGSNVFIKSIQEAKKNDFFKKINNYFKNYPIKEKLVRFGVYSHEDFNIQPQNSDLDTKNRKEMERNGLDDVKIYVEKYYMGTDKLVQILKNMKTEFDKKLMILDPGTYQDYKLDNIDMLRTLWLIVDKSIDKNSRFPGEDQYFICYEQRYSNKNPFHLNDEYKPGWIAPTTIPHTLIGAMINITRPWLSDKREINFCDPFVGSGTTLLEMLKFSSVEINCSDKASMVCLLAKDNLEFFSFSSDQLKEFEKKLTALWNKINGIENDYRIEDSQGMSTYSEEFVLAVNLWLQVGGINESDYQFESSIVQKLIKIDDVYKRILFYLALRTKQRHIIKEVTNEIDWMTAYSKEVSQLMCLLKGIIELRNQEEKGEEEGCSKSTTIKVFQGKYSKYCSIRQDYLAKISNKIKLNNETQIGLAYEVDKCSIITVDVEDIKKLKGKTYDIIVTDPPYGFNTDFSKKDLAEMYSDAIRNMIKALKPNGQLVICLLDSVRTGKESPFFIHKEFVVQQILMASEELKREVINSMVKVSPSDEIFQGPYYWESERSLRRSILHFRIK